MKPLLLKIQRLGEALPNIFSHSVGVCLIEEPAAATSLCHIENPRLDANGGYLGNDLG